MTAAARLQIGSWVALAAAAVSLLLAACGGGDDHAPPARVANPDRPTEASGVPGAAHEPRKDRLQSQDPAPRKQAESPDTAGAGKPSGKRKVAPKRDEETEESGTHSQGVPASRKPCPNGISRRVCAQLETGQKSGGTDTSTATTHCPPVLSEAQCRELGQAGEVEKGEQSEPAPECPPALTDAQCQELARTENGG